MPVKVDADLCVACEACCGVCPTGSLSIVDGKCQCNGDTCVDCGACIGTCPCDAISQ